MFYKSQNKLNTNRSIIIMLKILVICLINVIIIGYLYIRIKFQFWSLQPVFHIYDINHWLCTNKIIQPQLPGINKYINFKNINTYNNKQLPSSIKEECAAFISDNYLRSKLVNYLPTEEDIFSYLSCSVGGSFVTTYRDYNKRENNLIGVITARPLFITFPGISPLMVNYIDNLTVRKDRRKEGIAPQLIQTHHYNIRHQEKNVKICLFNQLFGGETLLSLDDRPKNKVIVNVAQTLPVFQHLVQDDTSSFPLIDLTVVIRLNREIVLS